MRGTIAITDDGWYEALRVRNDLEEVNFWKPSSTRAFLAPEFSPFLFKLRAPRHAICGFAFFARYSVLPDWLAWDAFGLGNGVGSFPELVSRIREIRRRISFAGDVVADPIGCVLLVEPVFFPPDRLVAAPSTWPVRTQSYMRYDLGTGEGARVWSECLDRAPRLTESWKNAVKEPDEHRYGVPQVVTPRLGQGVFRVAVTDAYSRACAMTGEHSLPALEAAHIFSYKEGGPHEVANGLLLRADLHRLFDKGYVTVSSDLKVEVSSRLRSDFANGRSYYPIHGRVLTLPNGPKNHPSSAFLAWHREKRYRG